MACDEPEERFLIPEGPERQPQLHCPYSSFFPIHRHQLGHLEGEQTFSVQQRLDYRKQTNKKRSYL